MLGVSLEKRDISDIIDFFQEFSILLRARYPILYIVTDDEERVEYVLEYGAKKKVTRTSYTWDYADGYQGNLRNKGFAAYNPRAALDLIDKSSPETSSIFILKDYDTFFNDIGVVRKLKNLSQSLKTKSKNIVILSSDVNVPDSLKGWVTILEFPMPSYSVILGELNRLVSVTQQNVESRTLNNIASACQGLSLERIRRILSKVIAKYGKFDESTLDLILQDKKQSIQQMELLEFCINEKNFTDLGGLDNFKHWLHMRSKAFSNQAIQYGLPYPKGLLLVGVQGTGKSMAAKIIGSEWQLPLLRLDFGRLFGSLLGQSEQRVRKIIQISEVMSPCVLWIDEIEKALGESESVGSNGTISRVISTVITWLSEKTSAVFVVATANNTDRIPPEVLRKGRFDEMFFFDLPTREEREVIFEVHLNKYRPGSKTTFQMSLFSQLSKEFSGAEIESVIVDAMRLGFSQEREFNNEDVLDAIQNLVPLARIKSDELRAIRSWAEGRNVRSASKYR
jgi:ATP-dependent 26S proteasome regulatory subunit